jgi:biopolymer transport protein ExbD
MKFRKEEEENFNFDLTPMIDVVFLLLIFFMVSTAFVDFSHRMDIALPSSKSSAVNETPQEVTVEMTLSKEILLNGKTLTLKELEVKIAEFAKSEKATAIIKADKGLPYGNVVEVMGVIQSSGIGDISVAVK